MGKLSALRKLLTRTVKRLFADFDMHAYLFVTDESRLLQKMFI